MSEYKEIILSNGEVTKVDSDDFHYLNKWRWKKHVGGYACRSAGSRKQGWKCVLIHREVANTPEGMETDHINGDKLDNRKANLRNVDRSLNEFNKPVNVRNTSGHRGVCWDKSRNCWMARVSKKQLGRFKNLDEAVKRRREYMIEKGIRCP